MPRTRSKSKARKSSQSKRRTSSPATRKKETVKSKAKVRTRTGSRASKRQRSRSQPSKTKREEVKSAGKRRNSVRFDGAERSRSRTKSSTPKKRTVRASRKVSKGIQKRKQVTHSSQKSQPRDAKICRPKKRMVNSTARFTRNQTRSQVSNSSQKYQRSRKATKRYAATRGKTGRSKPRAKRPRRTSHKVKKSVGKSKSKRSELEDDDNDSEKDDGYDADSENNSDDNDSGSGSDCDSDPDDDCGSKSSSNKRKVQKGKVKRRCRVSLKRRRRRDYSRSHSSSPPSRGRVIKKSSSGSCGCKRRRGSAADWACVNNRCIHDTKSLPDITRYLAIDCRYVTIKGNEFVGRVSLTDCGGVVMFDKYCACPEDLSEDQWTGLHAKTGNSTKSLDSIRKRIKTLIKNKILVGFDLHKHMNYLGIKKSRRDLRHLKTHQSILNMINFEERDTITLHALSRQVLHYDLASLQDCSVLDAQSSMLLFLIVRSEWEKNLNRIRKRDAKKAKEQQNKKSN